MLSECWFGQADEGRAQGIASLRAAYEAAVEEREARAEQEVEGVKKQWAQEEEAKIQEQMVEEMSRVTQFKLQWEQKEKAYMIN